MDMQSRPLPIPQTCPNPSSHRIGKTEEASRRRSQRCEQADSLLYLHDDFPVFF